MSTKQKNIVFKVIIYLIFILYILSLIYILLFKNGDAFILSQYINKKSFIEKLSYAQLVPFTTIKEFIFEAPTYLIAIKNLVGNIIIFCPLGFLLPLISMKLNSWKKVILIIFLISFLIESIQLVTGLGFFDVDDLILNTLGGIIGYWIYKLFKNFIVKK
ncbi:VanZ family protein [Clostridium perfringens]|uniref:VanZ family protein n=1 Tax=Clostridium perfringens TaxID=1502 RepID=UPI0018E4A418|nr:VanZ family protein [Clostridium perfringens]MBI5978599.1 VanZ family protein [Clostridium perfringens]MBI5981531.1 VanZ family protein [Clostridium perfringens]MBI5984332.1 VanZ family protein [Clostridium perfringens]MBI5989994.1 VanZ family protein [Clostridium perfringens]MBI5995907.1 VanZ family protein [Clostridium perfringens]